MTTYCQWDHKPDTVPNMGVCATCGETATKEVTPRKDLEGNWLKVWVCGCGKLEKYEKQIGEVDSVG